MLRTLRAGAAVALAVALPVGAAGCGHSSPSASTTLPAASTTVAAPATPATPTTPGTAATPATTSVPSAQNLQVTNDIRAQLLAAGAAAHGLAASDYLGLRPGETYYAVDATGVHWAGAGLEPSPSSLPAQVASQDDGAYLLFEQPVGEAWRVFDVGLAGVGGTPSCPIAVPAAVLALWGWPPAHCRPAEISCGRPWLRSLARKVPCWTVARGRERRWRTRASLS
jgi:hypothetical protein